MKSHVWRLVGVVEFAVLALVSIALAVAWHGMVWMWLALGAFCSTEAMLAAQMYKIRRDALPSVAPVAAYRRKGQGFCVAGALWLISAVTSNSRAAWFAGFVFLTIGTAYVFFLREDAEGSATSPFSAPEVEEIRAHLTEEERARLDEHARDCGRQIATWIPWMSLPLALVPASLFWSPRAGLAGGALFAVFFASAVWPRLRAMQRRTRELMCESEWARTHGYSVETLRLFVLPWPR